MSDDEGTSRKSGAYRIEYAARGQANCNGNKWCKEGPEPKIAKGGLRVGAWVKFREHGSFKWRHWGCVTPKVISNLKTAFEDPAELDGYEDLRPEDQTRIKDAYDQGHIAPEDVNPNSLSREPPPAESGEEGADEKPSPKKKTATKRKAKKEEEDDDADGQVVEKPKKKRRTKKEMAAAAEETAAAALEAKQGDDAEEKPKLEQANGGKADEEANVTTETILPIEDEAVDDEVAKPDATTAETASEVPMSKPSGKLVRRSSRSKTETPAPENETIEVKPKVKGRATRKKK
ncbi:uncharacterized protein L969DRAFT_87779 [Mixia osmundae IAM 14324]|uniref:PARP-type domain-containing protein n=1 Tax=Mixia osmundae (strain CBS 9802 / IAM 14324 / JCM 22182 / KY 12970) TaxID=764103 RepID=G7E4B2_MIXOS|nr:uncharacterized protein L969DRAFT_87779 [Mixia osmundae IAM 14324]KEI39769.1 hypothetical protein L969DRAFT_87779 [Mixia osmundae IAM 14324]GAA97672.1 hypothetical protein E5Q_04350 [Mixia osmundae IAM 14324]